MADDAVAFIQGLYGDFERGDLDAIVARCAPDVDWTSVGRASDFPAYGPRSGRDAVRDYFHVFAEHLDFQAFEPREFHAVDGKVFVLGHSRMVMRSTGRPIEIDWAHVFTLKDGAVETFRDYHDTAQAADALRG